MTARILLLACLALPLTAQAQSFDTSYFLAHPDSRANALRLCRDNAAYARLPTCHNAEWANKRAEADILLRRTLPGAQRGFSRLDSPDYWDSNPIYRDGILGQCRRRGPGDAIAYPYCQAAAASRLRQLAQRR